ncbi:hypothetical protein OE749_15145 [Aestuariibacter sp. AA17]|uniref:Right handed beta helix domain-containing protein n=1 Tax=Fluctibacter corallii TaxID=2984329 RepID=A0ABT3ABH0_9ALTE|nr:hypothetical protein [Aestuariibacter sp. AA17]MCV2886028.1 hypothetical protein [Aestuariibacter sp. AA17]
MRIYKLLGRLAVKLVVLLVSFTFALPVLAKEINVDGTLYPSLSEAFSHAKDGSIIKISAGDYQDAAILKADNVMIIGEPGTRIFGKATKGKGALLIQGTNTLIKQIECFNIQVRDRNGACVRLEGKHLILDNVYFHDSQQGVLTGAQPGIVHIINSRFERLGAGGRAHGIYVGGGTLIIEDSQFLSSKGEGHEVKSRAKETRIIRSVIASLSGKDSRLVDVPNGGKLEIIASVLQQGTETSNWNLVGYGLEDYKYDMNSVTIKDNIFVLDRHANQVLNIKHQRVKPVVEGNIFVGNMQDAFEAGNMVFKSRESAGLEAAPNLPLLN